MKTTPKSRNKIPVINGDIFDYIKSYIHQGNNGFSVIVPHICNNINLFGAGFASAVARHYPIVKENYHLLGNKNTLGYVQFVEAEKSPVYGHKLIFANMIAQNGVINPSNSKPLSYFALTQCMSSVSSFVRKTFDLTDNKAQIHCPKFGCGLAGGNWSLIEELIADIWANQTVFVYQK